VMCAVNKACLEEERGTMKAKTLNMQIIHCLGSTSNVSITAICTHPVIPSTVEQLEHLFLHSGAGSQISLELRAI